MKILLVIDQYDAANNGTTISARRFAGALRARGHEVRVVACGAPAADKYVVPAMPFLPVAANIIASQGMRLARPKKSVLREAFAWADVVHFMMPFALSRSGLKLAEQMGVPHTAAFHVQPENITYTLGMGRWQRANDAIYNELRDDFYNRFTHLHCPSSFIAGELQKRGYTAQIHVISNGISPRFCWRKREKSGALAGKTVITMIGRLSNEKRQDVLIDAVGQCRHREEIQLVLAGQGPKKRALQRRGASLPHPPIFGFFPEEKLRELLAMTDLYVHASDAEIEAISCIEAFASGLVPVIADSPKSATPQFALDERSLFAAGDSAALAERIDYWLDHPEERRQMELRYAEAGKAYHLDACAAKAEAMFAAAIAEAPACGEQA